MPQYCVQVQTLYYLGPASTGRRKRTAAAAAQQGTCEATGAEAGTGEPAAEPEEAASKKGGKRSKRRKKGAAVSGKENSTPDEEAAARQKESSPPTAEQEVRSSDSLWAVSPAYDSMSSCGGTTSTILAVGAQLMLLSEDAARPDSEMITVSAARTS